MSGSVIVQEASKRSKKKRGWMGYVQLVILVGIVAAIYLSFSGNVLSTTPGVPALIANFTLSHVETGDKALAEIRTLYGEEVTYAKAYLAHYRGDSGGVTVRVGEKTEAKDAEGVVKAVVSGVEKGEKKGFSDLKRSDVAGTVMYSIKINNMPQYLYQSENKVIWVDIMEGSPDQVLPDVVRGFK